MIVIEGGLVLQKDGVFANLQQESSFSIGDVRAALGLLRGAAHKIDVEVATAEQALRAALEETHVAYLDGLDSAEIGWDRAMVDVALAKHQVVEQ